VADDTPESPALPHAVALQRLTEIEIPTAEYESVKKSGVEPPKPRL
jgi:hypothetical protein